MSIIKNIGNLPPEFRRTERNDKQSEIRRSGESSAPAPVKNEQVPKHTTDQVNVSESARTLLQRDHEIERFSANMSAVETLSDDERKDIEAKIDSGFYSSPEVTSFVAGKIAAETELPQKSLSPTRMQEVIENIRSNQYSSEGVLDVVANKILKDLENL